MGFIRGGMLSVVAVLFLCVFLVGNLFWTLNLSLSYDAISSELGSVFGGEMSFEEAHSDLVRDCKNKSFIDFSDDKTISCEIVNQGPDAVQDFLVSDFLDEIYYKDYECEMKMTNLFVDCFEKSETPYFLVSEQAKDYFGSKFYFSLFVCLVLFGLMFLLVENKSNAFIISGILIIVSSLPFMKIGIFTFIFKFSEVFSQVVSVVFGEAYSVFLMSLFFGIFVLGIGILLKFFKLGFYISKLFNKDGKGDGGKKGKFGEGEKKGGKKVIDGKDVVKNEGGKKVEKVEGKKGDK